MSRTCLSKYDPRKAFDMNYRQTLTEELKKGECLDKLTKGETFNICMNASSDLERQLSDPFPVENDVKQTDLDVVAHFNTDSS